MKLSEDLAWRGLLKDRTFQDDTWLDTPRKFYLGADAGSADSLTIGNLAIFLLARRLLDAGWETVLLMGGATSLIGDPGGKDSERPLVSREDVEANKAGIREQVANLFAGQSFEFVDNYDWFKDMHYLEFLRDVGKHFSVTELVQRDFIAERVGPDGAGISYAEFSYSLIQGYDFWHLYKYNQVVMQIGGSDQWGNMISGVPLIRKKEAGEAHALSMPLVINQETGKKFGKSEAGAIWLDAKKTSVYKFYQFWLNCDDAGVEYYLKIYTFLQKQEIDDLMTEFNQNRGTRLAQKRLAAEVTNLVHGQAALARVEKLTETIFSDAHLDDLTEQDIDLLVHELPHTNATPGDDMLELLVRLELASSKGDARRVLGEGGIRVNGVKLLANQTSLGDEHFIGQSTRRFALVRRGKNKLGLVQTP